MPRQLTEAIFNSKNNINDFYPQFAGTPSFDLERKHLFYGRINKNSDAVLLILFQTLLTICEGTFKKWLIAIL